MEAEAEAEEEEAEAEAEEEDAEVEAEAEAGAGRGLGAKDGGLKRSGGRRARLPSTDIALGSCEIRLVERAG